MNWTKIKLGNWLFHQCFPLYNLAYAQFKHKNDRHEIALLKQLIKPGFQILDIGANIGYYSKLLSRLTTHQGRVYCFEPDHTNFQHLQNNTQHLPNVTLLNAAVSDTTGPLTIYKSKLLNVDHRTYPVDNHGGIETIQAVCIDDFLAKQAIMRVDFIKIDIQGYELAAFKGMQHLLQQPHPATILAEYWPHGFKRAGTSAVEFFNFFTPFNYQFHRLEQGRLLPLNSEFVAQHNDEPYEFYFNVLMTPKSSKADKPL